MCDESDESTFWYEINTPSADQWICEVLEGDTKQTICNASADVAVSTALRNSFAQ